MTGRGRGRGMNMSFNIEALGITKGESLPATDQPPPTFPTLLYKALPLVQSEEENYLLALKQEYRSAIRDLPYYYIPKEKKTEIERYSDKYQNGNSNATDDWIPDMSYMPDELIIRKIRKTKKIAPNIKAAKGNSISTNDIDKTLKKLEVNENNETTKDSDSESGKETENEEEVEADIYDEEEMEEETDYILSYFDNGEGNDDEDDNLDDGPTYS